jgi:outer membrane autotransporter protein
LPAAGIIFGSASTATVDNAGTIGALSDRAIATSDALPAATDVVIVNSGTIEGFIQLEAGVNSVINNSTFNLRHFADTNGDGVRDTVRVAVADFGSGTSNTFENNGTLTLPGAAGATTLDNSGQYLPLGNPQHVMSLGGPVQGQILGVATFTNSGTIDLHSNPVPGDVLVISGGHTPGTNGGGVFVSNGGTITIDTVLNEGGAAALSDVVVVDSTSIGAGGATKANIINAGGKGALTVGDGILVVEGKGTTGSTAGTFGLGKIVAAGPYEYLLFHGGLTPGTENNWYLRSEAGPIPPEPPITEPPTTPTTPPTTPTAPPTTPTTPPTTPTMPPTTPTTPPTTPTPTPPEPEYRMEDPLYSKISLLARQVSLLMLGTFHERHGDQSLVMNDEGGVWARLIGVGLSQKFSGPLEPSFNGTVGGAQMGSDAYVWDNRSNRVGGFASYAHASGTVRGDILDVRDQLGGELPEDVFAAGGYFTHIGDNGWYVDTVLMGSWYNAYPMSERGIGTHTTGSGVTASLEGDYPWLRDEEWTLESMGQIIFTSLSFASASDAFTTLDFQPGDAWYGRLGARLERNATMDGRPIKPFFELNLWKGFGGTDTTVYNANIPIATPYGNTDIEAAIGLASQVSESSSLNVRLGYLTSIEGNYQQAYKGQIGFRYAW